MAGIAKRNHVYFIDIFACFFWLRLTVYNWIVKILFCEDVLMNSE